MYTYLKIKLKEKELQRYNEVFEFIEEEFPNCEKLITEGNFKIKTNQHEIQFAPIEQILKKFNLHITDVSFTDYYGIVFGIKFKE